MLTEKDYCDYETCVALKKLGFDERCHGYYEPLKKCFYTTSVRKCWCNSEVDDINVIICPTLYEAQKWLREEMRVIVYPQYLTNGQTWMCMVYEEKKMLMHSVGRGSYNEVLNEGIKEAVKILKENK